MLQRYRISKTCPTIHQVALVCSRRLILLLLGIHGRLYECLILTARRSAIGFTIQASFVRESVGSKRRLRALAQR